MTNILYRLAPLVGLWLVACAQSPGDDVGTNEVVSEEPTLSIELAYTSTVVAPVCSVVFSPEESLRVEVEASTARWAAATGCDIRVGEGGIPVRVSADLGLSPRGTRVHGWTHCPDPEAGCRRSELIIEVLADHKSAAMVHEIGHALPNRSGHIEGAALMSAGGGDGLISSEDLTYVCERLQCQAFVPEV